MRYNIIQTSIFAFVAALIPAFSVSCSEKKPVAKTATTENKLTVDQLQNKIKGGWAGQTIGVVYGAPVEFKYQGSIIPDYQNIPWREAYVKYWWDKKPGLFDDIYTDLNFVNVFEKYGMNVSMDTIAKVLGIHCLSSGPCQSGIAIQYSEWHHAPSVG
jgi:hypothetical protein